MKSPSCARLCDSSSRNRSITDCDGEDAELARVELLRLAQDLAQDLVADVCAVLSSPRPCAGRAGLAQHVRERFARALARHLDQAELREAVDRQRVRSRRERLVELGQHRVAVLGVLHVDEVDDDDAAEVAQPQLARDHLRRLEVGLEDRVVEAAAADEAAGVDVDRRQRLGLVDDQVAAATSDRRGARAPSRSRPRRRTGRTAAARRGSARCARRSAGVYSRANSCIFAKVSRESTRMRAVSSVDMSRSTRMREIQVLVEQRRRAAPRASARRGRARACVRYSMSACSSRSVAVSAIVRMMKPPLCPSRQQLLQLARAALRAPPRPRCAARCRCANPAAGRRAGGRRG